MIYTLNLLHVPLPEVRHAAWPVSTVTHRLHWQEMILDDKGRYTRCASVHPPYMLPRLVRSPTMRSTQHESNAELSRYGSNRRCTPLPWHEKGCTRLQQNESL